jgi:hypothetical protein
MVVEEVFVGVLGIIKDKVKVVHKVLAKLFINSLFDRFLFRHANDVHNNPECDIDCLGFELAEFKDTLYHWD